MPDLDTTDSFDPHQLDHLLTGPVLLVGAGKMGGALLAGWLESGLDPTHVFVQDPQPSPDTAEMLAKYEITASATPDLRSLPHVIVIAVKPQVIENVLPSLVPLITPTTLVISVAAGCLCAVFQTHFGAECNIIRAMPNTPAAIGHGITALYADGQVGDSDRDLAATLMATVGQVVWVTSEADMDAVTAISGSGPAYVFLLTEALTKAGIQIGLDADTALQLAKATVTGAGRLIETSELTPNVLREHVTSPGGTTQAALDILMDEASGLDPLLKRAVAAAKARSEDLSK